MRAPAGDRVIAFTNHPSKTLIKSLGQSKSGSKSNHSGAGQFDFGPDSDPDETRFSRFMLIKNPNAIAL
jgi:hypothetical protein